MPGISQLALIYLRSRVCTPFLSVVEEGACTCLLLDGGRGSGAPTGNCGLTHFWWGHGADELSREMQNPGGRRSWKGELPTLESGLHPWRPALHPYFVILSGFRSGGQLTTKFKLTSLNIYNHLIINWEPETWEPGISVLCEVGKYAHWPYQWSYGNGHRSCTTIPAWDVGWPNYPALAFTNLLSRRLETQCKHCESVLKFNCLLLLHRKAIDFVC